MLAASEMESASSGLDDPSGFDGSIMACTWSFTACVRLKDYKKTFSNFLDARNPQMNIALAPAKAISWACTNTTRIQSQDSFFEGFVHSSTHIWLGSLRCVLPKKQLTYAGEIFKVTFEEPRR